MILLNIGIADSFFSLKITLVNISIEWLISIPIKVNSLIDENSAETMNEDFEFENRWHLFSVCNIIYLEINEEINHWDRADVFSWVKLSSYQQPLTIDVFINETFQSLMCIYIQEFDIEHCLQLKNRVGETFFLIFDNSGVDNAVRWCSSWWTEEDSIV